MLLDIEWIETENKKKEITQIAAIRVDESWILTESFDAVVSPADLAAVDSEHIALSGYPLESFENGAKEEDAIRRFSQWLQEEDALCVWHHDTGVLLSAAWQTIFHSRLPYPVLCANRRVCHAVRNGSGNLESLYSIAVALGIPVGIPHCSTDDVELMRRVFAAVGLSQKKLRKESVSPERVQGPVDRNRAILVKTQYHYIFIPGSSVFHTRDCPCILHAKKIEGSVYYRTAAKSRRPCKICKPEPDVQAAVLSEPKPKAAKKASEPAIDFKEIVRAKLLGGTVIEARRGNIIGYCHNLKHPGKLTKAILDEHKCLEKQCPLLEKYEDVPFWVERKKKKLARDRAKQHKKEKKALLLAEAESMIELRDDFQMYADFTDSEMDVIRVEHPNPHTYTVFYVSDNRFADGNRFPAFLEALKESYERCRIILRHIKDLDGHFVTRDEYYARKR